MDIEKKDSWNHFFEKQKYREIGDVKENDLDFLISNNEDLESSTKAALTNLKYSKGDLEALNLRDKIAIFLQIKTKISSISAFDEIDLNMISKHLNIDLALDSKIDNSLRFYFEGFLLSMMPPDIDEKTKAKISKKFEDVFYYYFEKNEDPDFIAEMLAESGVNFSLQYSTKLSLGFDPSKAAIEAIRYDLKSSVKNEKEFDSLEHLSKNGFSPSAIAFLVDKFFLAGKGNEMINCLRVGNKKGAQDALMSLQIIGIAQTLGIKVASQIGEKISFFIANKFPYIEDISLKFDNIYEQHLKQA